MIASVGSYGGPAGAVLVSLVRQLQVWAKWVNAKGGVNGHPVHLLVYDDGADPARHRSQKQEAIERRGVVAFVADAEGLTGQGSVEYVTSKRVPVIGSEGASYWFYTSPMYFPQASTDVALFYGTIAAAAGHLVPQGKTKIATVVCAEGVGCGRTADAFAKYGPALGLSLVYRAKASLAQPDYTAECLSARNAGAQAVAIILDTASIGRFSAACTRQGYRPNYVTVMSPVVDRMKEDPNLEGLVANSNVFPWFQSNTPASQEAQEAMRAYGGGRFTSGQEAPGWVAGKLFEKAAAHLPDPPTSEAVLQGLWSMHDEDLGGITQPLTFNANQSAPVIACWFSMVIKDRAWTTPDNFTRHCRNEPIELG